jgi:hypothetical protein
MKMYVAVHIIINFLKLEKGNQMNTSETLEKMSQMRLLGMKETYSLHLETGGKITNDELVALPAFS